MNLGPLCLSAPAWPGLTLVPQWTGEVERSILVPKVDSCSLLMIGLLGSRPLWGSCPIVGTRIARAIPRIVTILRSDPTCELILCASPRWLSPAALSPLGRRIRVILPKPRIHRALSGHHGGRDSWKDVRHQRRVLGSWADEGGVPVFTRFGRPDTPPPETDG